MQRVEKRLYRWVYEGQTKGSQNRVFIACFENRIIKTHSRYYERKHKTDEGKNKKGNAAVGMHDGFLTGYTLSRLIRFKAYVQEDGYTLAKLFVEAGLAVPEEVFIATFSKYSISEDE